MKVRGLAPSGKVGQSMRLAIWSVTKRSCLRDWALGVGSMRLAVNSLCGNSVDRGGVKCSR